MVKSDLCIFYNFILNCKNGSKLKSYHSSSDSRSRQRFMNIIANYTLTTHSMSLKAIDNNCEGS